MKIPLPRWLDEMPDGLEKLRAENRFFFRLWCLYASEKGTLGELARLIETNPGTLSSQGRSHNVRGVTPSTLIAVRRLLGPEFVRVRGIPDRRFRDTR